MYNITEDDYTFVEQDGQEQWVIRLNTGVWKDTFYCYDHVKLIPPEGGWELLEDGEEEATLSFRYGLIESPYELEELSEDREFNDYISDILRHIIQDSFDSGKYRLGDKDGEQE